MFEAGGMFELRWELPELWKQASRKNCEEWKWSLEECFKKLQFELGNDIAHSASKKGRDRNLIIDASDYSWAVVITQTTRQKRDLPIEERQHEILHMMPGMKGSH